MKPLLLKMTAFGPYKYTETIDFRELKDYQLFVISGNTGAGKTTIFDGICFALYGSASGQDRENNMMLRSDFAEDDTHTAVELEFELKGRHYRILRQLGHVKQGNKTKTGEKYEFFEKVNGVEIPCVDRQIVSEINQKVEELIGLTQDQFKQIVMLPQGEFRKLLTSQTENKEEILRRLFKTDSYKLIGEKLRERKKRVEEAFQQEKQLQDTYIQHITATLPDRENAPIFQVLNQEQYNVQQVIEGLEVEAAFYENKIVEDEKKYEKAYKAHDVKQREFHQGQALNERFDELDRKRQQLNAFVEQGPIFTEKAKQLQEAERASTIEPYEKQAKEWLAEVVEKESAAEVAEVAEKRAVATYETVRKAYEEEEGKKPVREQLAQRLHQLQEWLPDVKELNERKNEIARLQSEAKQTVERLTKVRSELEEKNTAYERDQEEIRKLDRAVAELPDKQKTLHEMREQMRVLLNYNKIQKEIAQLQVDAKGKQEAFTKIKDEYGKLEASWLQNQAAMLASHLHDGEACPVCGSLDHPHKAVTGPGMVTREQLEVVKQQVDEKDSLYRNVVASLHAKQEQLDEKIKELNEFGIRVEEIAEVQKQLVDAGKKLNTEVEQLEAARKKLAQLKERAEKVQGELKQLEAERDKQDQLLQKQKTAYETARAIYDDRLGKIPEEVRNLPLLEKQIFEVEKEKVQLERAWEKVQKDLQQASEAKTKATSQLEHAKNTLAETITKQEKAERDFLEALTKAEFSSKEQYEAAKMTEGARKQLKEEIERYKQNVATMKEQVAQLEESLQGKARVELDHLAAQLRELKEAYEVALREWNQSKEYLQETEKLIENISDVHERIRKGEQQLAILTDLYDVIRGQNSHKISFERYLQIEYLERIIEAANERLSTLSNGQYELRRSDRQESHGRQSGLALDVYDAYTGQTRDVKTLSGGEKFNASLCLALGMSDVIQSFQGNISIDTMFIDEGFGTLDEESLNKAIDTLVDLQQSGRMIGVISHVQELKTIFPAVLEVKKMKEGYSQTKFVLK